MSLGTPLPWEESKEFSDHIRKNGIEQLINIFSKSAGRDGDQFFWGDEVEYMLIQFNDEHKTAKLNITKDHILEDLNEGGALFHLATENNINMHPEYGRFMLEATPRAPYDGEVLEDYVYVEKNMALRRTVANKALDDEHIKPLTVASFPLMGVGSFTEPGINLSEVGNDSSRSSFLPDEIINRHVRFPTLTANIRKRRGEKVAINIPFYKDTNTPKFDDSIPYERCKYPEDEESLLGALIPNHIYMDSMGFGMGCSCLQVTMQAPNIHKARYLYDSLLNFAPIFLALTSASPIFKGFLADQDVRWNVISKSVDDRTAYERNVAPLRPNNEFGGIKDCSKAQRIPKSRYDSVDLYLGDLNLFKPELNDVESPINKDIYDKLLAASVDENMAKHFAHLFIRDPLVIFSEKLNNQDNKTENDHFENIQSTNWQTLRFKPPPLTADPEAATPGWRVEFRPMEIQITDFENAAFSNFLVLLSHAILHNTGNWNFYIPISLIEENMATAHKLNPVDRLYNFKQDISSKDFASTKLSVNEIFNGCSTFVGLIPLVEQHLQSYFKLSKDSNSKIFTYLLFIKLRSSGKIPTTSKFIRDFVINHSEYKHDSKVSELINYELLKKVDRISNYDNSLGEVSHFFGDELGQLLSKQ